MPIKFLRKIKLRAKTDSTKSFEESVNSQSPYVEGVYVFPCQDLSSRQLLFNDGHPSLLLMPERSDPVRITAKEATQVFDAAWMCCGIIENTYLEIPKGLEYLLVIRFKENYFYEIFDVSPEVFRKQPICNFLDIVSPEWGAVIDQIYQEKSIQRKIHLLDEQLALVQIDLDRNYPALLAWIVQYINTHSNTTSVQEILALVGTRVNRKWLQRNFVKYVGLSPKKYISLQRFIHAYQDHPAGWDRLATAVTCGYYDQHHLSKDFKRYTGKSPS